MEKLTTGYVYGRPGRYTIKFEGVAQLMVQIRSGDPSKCVDLTGEYMSGDDRIRLNQTGCRGVVLREDGRPIGGYSGYIVSGRVITEMEKLTTGYVYGRPGRYTIKFEGVAQLMVQIRSGDPSKCVDLTGEYMSGDDRIRLNQTGCRGVVLREDGKTVGGYMILGRNITEMEKHAKGYVYGTTGRYMIKFEGEDQPVLQIRSGDPTKCLDLTGEYKGSGVRLRLNQSGCRGMVFQEDGTVAGEFEVSGRRITEFQKHLTGEVDGRQGSYTLKFDGYDQTLVQIPSVKPTPEAPHD